MATAPTLLPIDTYLHTSYKPDVHFVDGEIEERNVGEYTHSFLQSFFVLAFHRSVESWGLEAIVEQRIRVGTGRVRVCDVSVMAADEPIEEVRVTPPLICIEILSPEDRISRSERVLADYFTMGVPNIWLIDPVRRLAHTYDSGGLHSADPANLAVPGTPIRIDLTEAFAQLDRKAARSAT